MLEQYILRLIASIRSQQNVVQHQIAALNMAAFPNAAAYRAARDILLAQLTSLRRDERDALDLLRTAGAGIKAQDKDATPFSLLAGSGGGPGSSAAGQAIGSRTASAAAGLTRFAGAAVGGAIGTAVGGPAGGATGAMRGTQVSEGVIGLGRAAKNAAEELKKLSIAGQATIQFFGHFSAGGMQTIMSGWQQDFLRNRKIALAIDQNMSVAMKANQASKDAWVKWDILANKFSLTVGTLYSNISTGIGKAVGWVIQKDMEAINDIIDDLMKFNNQLINPLLKKLKFDLNDAGAPRVDAFEAAMFASIAQREMDLNLPLGALRAQKGQFVEPGLDPNAPDVQKKMAEPERAPAGAAAAVGPGARVGINVPPGGALPAMANPAQQPANPAALGNPQPAQPAQPAQAEPRKKPRKPTLPADAIEIKADIDQPNENLVMNDNATMDRIRGDWSRLLDAQSQPVFG